MISIFISAKSNNSYNPSITSFKIKILEKEVQFNLRSPKNSPNCPKKYIGTRTHYLNSSVNGHNRQEMFQQLHTKMIII